MHQKKKLIHNRTQNTFAALEIDTEMLQRIVVDMKENAGVLAPTVQWQMLERSPQKLQQIQEDTLSLEELYEMQYHTAEQMLDAWIGVVGCAQLEQSQIDRYDSFLSAIDHLGVYKAFQDNITNRVWLNTDLVTLLEVNVLSMFRPDIQNKDTFFLEVGGGYGRLCEAMLNIFSGIRYVMVDAVPGSLMYAYSYLKNQLPDHKIGFFYNDDPFDMEEYDCYIMPAWQGGILDSYRYDYAVNIGSLQEMNQKHVDHYLALFDNLTDKGSHIYLSNAHDYLFQGTWNYPEGWERIFVGNTPYSWSPDHPTEIFRKTTVSDALIAKNKLLEEGYQYQLKLTLDEKALVQTKATQLDEAQAHLNRFAEKGREQAELAARREEEYCLLRTDFKEMQCKYEETAETIGILEKENNRIQTEMENIRGSYHQEKSQWIAAMDEILNSTSWKVTKPLRSLRKLMIGNKRA